jgi:YjbE family integral membrane protein
MERAAVVFMEIFGDAATIGALVQVVLIDLVLAGDNAIVIGLAAAGLPGDMRRKAIVFGVLGATGLRILLALATVQLLQIVGLLLAGGLLLLWVCWRMLVELRDTGIAEQHAHEALADADLNADGSIGPKVKTKSFGAAIGQIILADLSMSLDNVLAVAGAAREHVTALVFGLALSVVLMGFAASFIARLLGRFRWLAYVGLAVIVFVSLRMVWHGAAEVMEVQAAFFNGH